MQLGAHKLILAVVVASLTFILSWNVLRVPERSASLQIEVELTLSQDDDVELFYDTDGSGHRAQQRIVRKCIGSSEPQTIAFPLPPGVTTLNSVRVDPGTNATVVLLHGMTFRAPYAQHHWSALEVTDHMKAKNDLLDLHVMDGADILPLIAVGGDPYMTSKASLEGITGELASALRPVVRPFILAVAIGLFALVLVLLLPVERSKRPEEQESSANNSWAGFATASIVGLMVAGGVMMLSRSIHSNDLPVTMDFSVWAEHDDQFQLFQRQEAENYGSDHFSVSEVNGKRSWQAVSFDLMTDPMPTHVRFDPGRGQDTLGIASFGLHCADKAWRIPGKDLLRIISLNDQIDTVTTSGDTLWMRFDGSDPHMATLPNMQPLFLVMHRDQPRGPMSWSFAFLAGMFTFFGLRSMNRGDRRISRSGERTLISMFCTVISIPAVAMVLGIGSNERNLEKRMMAERPTFDLAHIDAYPKAFTEFIADDFAFRGVLFRWNALMHRHFHSSPLPEKVMYGRDEMLFMQHPVANRVYQGGPIFSEDELKILSTRLERRRIRLAEQGISYYLMIPPCKATIYPEELPYGYGRSNAPSGLDLFIDHFRRHTKVPVIDVRELLLEGKRNAPMYYTSDIHWTPLGGFLAYTELINVLRKDHPEIGPHMSLSDMDLIPTLDQQGDLAMQIGLSDIFERNYVQLDPKKKTGVAQDLEGALSITSPIIRNAVFMIGPDTTAPRLLVFRDSFAVDLIPHLSAHFSKSVHIWTPVFLTRSVEEVRPSIVIHEILEVFMRDLLEDRSDDEDDP